MTAFHFNALAQSVLRMVMSAFALIIVSTVCTAQANEIIRIGALKYGTLNWELDTIAKNGIDQQLGIELKAQYFAGEDTAAIALRAGEIDVIVSDWLEVARARATGDDLTFKPFSSTTGALLVAGNSPIQKLSDLKGKKIAVAGGKFDKNWIILQALARKGGGDLANDNEIVFGAPALLENMMKSGEFDAILNFWQNNARLEALGFRRLVGPVDAIRAMGAGGAVASLGYVFKESWAKQHPQAIGKFIEVITAAKQLLATSDSEWDRLVKDGVVKATEAELPIFKEQFRSGIPNRAVDAEERDAAELFKLLRQYGGDKLVGDTAELPNGTYWR